MTALTEREAETELRLHAAIRPEPDAVLVWVPDGRHGRRTAVRSAEHLAVLISALRADEFGIVERIDGRGPWGQTARVPGDDGDADSWIVELSDGSIDDFAQRAIRGAESDYPDRSGRSGPYELEPTERFRSFAAAEVLWAWEHGTLLTGITRTLKYLTYSERRSAGFAD